jgi:hypothetical protein
MAPWAQPPAAGGFLLSIKIDRGSFIIYTNKSRGAYEKAKGSSSAGE